MFPIIQSLQSTPILPNISFYLVDSIKCFLIIYVTHKHLFLSFYCVLYSAQLAFALLLYRLLFHTLSCNHISRFPQYASALFSKCRAKIISTILKACVTRLIGWKSTQSCEPFFFSIGMMIDY